MPQPAPQAEPRPGPRHARGAAGPPLDGGTILVTGASSGIGRAIARVVAPRAGRLGLVARRADRLHALRGEIEGRVDAAIVVLPADLELPEDRARLLARVAEELGSVDVLVNAAGAGLEADFAAADWLRLARMIELNAVAPLHLTRALLPGMIERRRGGILMVSSVLGAIPQPRVATYSGTKHLLSGFSEALDAELQGSGVLLCQVCPGPVVSEFGVLAGRRGGAPPPPFLALTPEQVAEAAVRGLERGRATVTPGWKIRAARLGWDLLPRALRRRVLRWQAGRGRAG